MEKVIGIKLGQHSRNVECVDKIYYYKALEDFEIGDTAIVYLPNGQCVGVPVVRVFEIDGDTLFETDGNGMREILVTKYTVGKLDDSKYRALKKAQEDFKEKRNTFRRAGRAVKKRIEYLVSQRTWEDWARLDVGVLTIVGDYYLAKNAYEKVAGAEEADREDKKIHGLFDTNEFSDDLPH